MASRVTNRETADLAGVHLAHAHPTLDAATTRMTLETGEAGETETQEGDAGEAVSVDTTIVGLLAAKA